MNDERKRTESKTLVEGDDAVKLATEINDAQGQLPAAIDSTTELESAVPAHDCGVEYWKSVRQDLARCLAKRRWIFLLLTISMLSMLVHAGPSLLSAVLHNPQHFQMSNSHDGKYHFTKAIAVATSLETSSRDGLLEMGRYYSTGADGGLNIKIISDACGGAGLPLRDGVLPSKKSIVDALNQCRDVSRGSSALRIAISAPRDRLVDLSSFNAIMKTVPRPLSSGCLIGLGSGDYITNSLEVNNKYLIPNSEAGKVRIFVQDEAGVAKGITVSKAFLGVKGSRCTSDFQIWYNGTGKIKLAAESEVNAIIYAPHADLEIGKDVVFRGAIVCKNACLTGGLILYDEGLRPITDW